MDNLLLIGLLTLLVGIGLTATHYLVVGIFTRKVMRALADDPDGANRALVRSRKRDTDDFPRL